VYTACHLLALGLTSTPSPQGQEIELARLRGATPPSPHRYLLPPSHRYLLPPPRARTQGAYKISPRHLAESAWAMQSSPVVPQSLASVLPHHYCAICETLAAIKQENDAQRANGIANPRVLIIGETSGVPPPLHCRSTTSPESGSRSTSTESARRSCTQARRGRRHPMSRP